MNRLTKELVRGLMEVDDTKVVALYGGGFKPPIAGHFNVVKQILKEYPEIDELKIFVGGKSRDGIDQEEALLIWDIYKNYLPNKITIEPVSAPIKNIYNYSKENPQEKVYWVLGRREGAEDDQKDIEIRQTTLLKNPKTYPNLSVKVITTSDEGMRGRNARKAISNREEFFKFLPTELEVQDKEKVFDLVSPTLNENITKSQLDSIESYADGLFNKLGIDIDFTKHFFDRLNDIRNKKPISVAELIGVFKKLYRKHGKPLSRTEDDLEAVVKDFNKNINIPFVIDVDQNGIDMTAKTIMRKQDFQTSNPIIPLEENTTYANHIDYKQQIKDFTKHMVTLGLNILPLPKVIFRHNDFSNAKDFFGKTAYYLPETQTIVLYTEGRHPKDVARSYAHEMIHHIQNLEGRIGDVNTTNTTENPNLNDIEREAYSEGNMLFRNWTDSIDGEITTDIEEGGSLIPIKIKKPKPDPFGINAYALELAKGLEEAIVNEGKYDSLVTKLASWTLNSWKMDFLEGYNEGKFEVEVGPGKDFDYPHLDFRYEAEATFGGIYRDKGSFARPLVPEVVIKYSLDIEELPRMWSRIAMDLRNTIRHEIEHLMQSGPNVKKGKEKEKDYTEREEIKSGKKPWWKIWRKKLKNVDYYKLAKEVDANLQGLYLQAKKSRTPLKDVIDNYVKYDLNLSIEDQEEVKRIWKERAPKLNIPLEEEYKKENTTQNKLIDAWKKETSSSELKMFCKRDGCGPAALDLKNFAKERGIELKRIEGFFHADKVASEKKDFTNQMKQEFLDQGGDFDDAKEREEWVANSKYSDQWKFIPHYWLEDNKGTVYDPVGQEQFIDAGYAKDLNPNRYSLTDDVNEELNEGDTYEKMAAKGKKAGNLKQGTVRKRLGIKKGEKVPMYKINKELARLRKMDKDKDKKGVQLGDKNQKYYKALQLSKTLKTTTNVNEADPKISEGRKKKKDPKKGTGKKPEGSSRRLYTDEDPSDTVKVKFSTRQDIVNTLNKKSFKNKAHARQSQVINLIHQRVRAALSRTKDPKKKKRLQTAFDYIKKRKEASKAKTKRLQAQKKKKKTNENINLPNHDGKAAPYGSGYKPVKEKKGGYGKGSGYRYRAIYKKDGKFYYMQDNPFSAGIRQEFGPFKTKAAALKKMGSFPAGTSYRDITENKEYTIYSDMDGVLVDFNKRFEQFSDNIAPQDYVDKFGLEAFWDLIDNKTGVRFWVGMDWMSDGKEYWNYIKKYNPMLLSSPSRKNESRLGKRIWAKRNMPGTKVILAYAENKKNYANANSILIDDMEKNIDQWRAAGGIGILHTSAASTIAQLKELGL